MKFVILATIVLAVTQVCTALPARASSPTHNLLLSANEFSVELYKNVARYRQGNLAVSPISAHHALGMVSVGAAGDTLKVLRNGLFLKHSMAANMAGFAGESKFLNYNGKNVMVKVANKVYASESFKVTEHFINIIKNSFHSQCEAINMQDHAAATKVMNKWVAKETKNKIKNIISSEELDDATTLVILNTIYFKGDWLMPFDSDLVRSLPFNIDKNTTKHVPTMFTNGQFTTGNVYNAKYIIVPYADPRMSMTIIVPNNDEDLTYIEQNLHYFNHKEMLKNGRTDSIDLYLPKFKIESSINLGPTLSEMGMGQIFENSANFSNLSKSQTKVSQVIQKVSMEVNEKGTEAAASTSASISLKMLPELFEVNRPSLMIIRLDDVNLFIGRLYNPSV